MTFYAPLGLLLLISAPALVGAYLWSLRRRRKQALTYSSVALLRSVLPRSSRWKRHVPVGLLALGLAALAVASARPQMSRSVPVARTSIILALDVSRSMCATDVDPNRITVEQRATRSFVEHQVAGTRIGLILFSGSAQLVVAPTRDKQELLKAIDGASTSRGTAIGAALLKSIDAIAAVNHDVKPVGDVPQAPPAAAPPAGHGYIPDIVVLLTDGANTRGIAPLDAVPYAVERRVRVYTIAFGTTTPAPLVCSAQQLGGFEDQFGGGFGGGGNFPGGGGFGGGRSPLQADLPTLQEVAQRTGAQAYTAENASQLQRVFSKLPRDVSTQKQNEEVTAWFAAIGSLLAAAALGASIRWSPYP